MKKILLLQIFSIFILINLNAQNKAILAADEMTYNFGTVYMGEKVEHSFQFVNKGNIPLIIYEATSSCGCTVPEKPNKPIMPGKTGEVKIVFDSAGRSGMQHKNVVVKSNTEPAYTTFYLNGEVWLKPKKKYMTIAEQLKQKEEEKLAKEKAERERIEAEIEAERLEQERLYLEQEAKKKAKKKKKEEMVIDVENDIEKTSDDGKIKAETLIVDKNDKNYKDKLKEFFNFNGEKKDDY